MPAKPLTPPQLEDAARLKKIFEKWQAQRKESKVAASQEAATDALALDFNQSSISQYVNGGIPLNQKAAVKFARGLGCTIAEFSPSIAAEIIEAMSHVGKIPGVGSVDDSTLHLLRPVEVHIVTRFRLTDSAGQTDILDMVNTVPVRGQVEAKPKAVSSPKRKADGK